MNAAGPLFTTLTPPECARLLKAARARRKPEAVRARIFAGPACPVCGRPGLQREVTGGMLITHSADMQCWWPAACGAAVWYDRRRKEAAA